MTSSNPIIHKRHHTLRMCLILVILMLPVVLNAQNIDWEVDATGFFDNSEGDHSYVQNQTLTGLRLTPQIGIRLQDGRHRIMGGVTGLSEWGHKGKISSVNALAYYQFRNDKVRFTFGSFLRDEVLSDQLESYLISDSIRYYQPLMQGFTLTYKTVNNLVEVYLDWTGVRKGTQREQFMAGLSTWKKLGIFKLGLKGHYYHYALSELNESQEHIHDYAIMKPFVGVELENLGILSNLEARVGALISLDRDRGQGRHWKTPAGLILELGTDIWRFHVNEMFYSGSRQMGFGLQHYGEFYWGEPYQYSGRWSRTDLTYDIFSQKHITLSAGIILHATRKGINHHQVLKLRFNIGSKDGVKVRF